MNKRIEKLIVQAGNYVDEVHTGPVPATFTGNPVWHKEFDKWTQFNEKFAQLIVHDILDQLTNDDALGAARIETIRGLALRYGVAR